MEEIRPDDFTDAASYLLKFARPLGNEIHQARYYLRSTSNLVARLAQHHEGRGAAITRACVRKAIAFSCVRYWPHPNGEEVLAHERQLKRQKNHRRFAPK